MSKKRRHLASSEEIAEVFDMGMTRRTLVVDGNNLLIRAIKATERVPLSADGVPTAGLHAFIQSLARYIREEKPYSMVVCFDGGVSAYRTAVFPEYKAARHEKPEVEEDESPFHLAKEFLTLSNIHHIEMKGVEADDLIAAYWRRKENDERVIILSGDKDFLQLLDGWTEQIRPQSGGLTERWTTNRVRTELGCKPEQIPLVMALTGDTSDGVIGVPGFGHKTAVKLLGQHDWDLDKLLDAGLPRLFGYRDVVMRNLKLVNLRDAMDGVEVQEPPKFEPTTYGSIMFNDLLTYLERLQMNTTKTRLIDNALWEENS